MRTLTLGVGLAISLSALVATGLQSQTVPGDSPSAFCWRGQALPSCSGFALFELEGGLAVASTKVVHQSSVVTSKYPVFHNELNWHLGAMRNVSVGWALGAALSLGTGSPTPLTGIRLRSRRWLKPPMSAEFEVGVTDTGKNDRFGSYFGWGPTVGARLNMGDYVSVFTRWEGAYAEGGSGTYSGSDIYFHREAGFHQGLYVGASGGSTVAVTGTAVLGAVVLWALYALSQTEF